MQASSSTPASGSGSASHADVDQHKPLNHLASARSPYLLQHKHDPVDWYEFTDHAFQKARDEGKLVFLSIGYSSCHWCHQMRYDSFSKQDVADALNRDYVSIKVDREERPDVDATYMQFIMALHGSGGWPLSAFLTPDAQPIFGGTFFPRHQFLAILDKLSTMWKDDRQSCLASARDISEQLSSRLGPRSGTKLDSLPSDTIGIKAAGHWMKRFDAKHGGFGDAPKFPTVSNTHHLLHRFVALANEGGMSGCWQTPETRKLADDALHASLFTLLQISRGGITDQLGGGVARYSVDDEWRVPHFEKMLYDQGQLLSVFCEAIQLANRSGDAKLAEMVPELEEAARGIVTYLERDLTNDAGGLYSAEDADSLPSADSIEKKEGAFYVWRQDEVESLLGKGSDEANVVVAHYGIRPDGNIPGESDPHGELTHQNMLHAVGPVRDTARKLGLDVGAAEAALESAKRKMLEARDRQRPRPHLDDKIIAAWNGLAISGLCKAAEVLPSSERGGDGGARARKMALAAAEFLVKNLYSESQNRLRRSWRDGEAGPWGFSSDYAFVTQAMLDLFELEGDARFLELAVKLQKRLDDGFWDDEIGGYFISEDAAGVSDRAGHGHGGGGGGGVESGAAGEAGDGSRLLTRQKDEQDGAEPSATSVAAHNLMRLCWLLDSEPESITARDGMGWAQRRDATIRAGGAVLERASFALGTLTTALLGQRSGGRQILISGPGLSSSSRASPGGGEAVGGATEGDDATVGSSKNVVEQEEKQTAQRMRDAVRRRFLPFRSVVLVDLDLVQDPETRRGLEFLSQHNAAVRTVLERGAATGADEGDQAASSGLTQAHLCRGFTCGLPIRDVARWEDELDRAAAGGGGALPV
ncbi:uncharacterized protein PSFLO_02634 [Pseudozyma flocculosa]|uniref:Spermatogenesis-associated protein 20-like TRX domain-containing protein n=1 Tax=Pseudozyma flocculosa TaxID=84751 RepID=A0A5C3EYJ7_9BASI|nr:uncharacterized protein PSFLO_02634 [Pseudozyma flocculosa]